MDALIAPFPLEFAVYSSERGKCAEDYPLVVNLMSSCVALVFGPWEPTETADGVEMGSEGAGITIRLVLFRVPPCMMHKWLPARGSGRYAGAVASLSSVAANGVKGELQPGRKKFQTGNKDCLV